MHAAYVKEANTMIPDQTPKRTVLPGSILLAKEDILENMLMSEQKTKVVTGCILG